MHEMPQVYRICLRENLLVVLRKFTTEIDSCREGLSRFLETKRQLFSRLYFVSDEELLDIYGRQQEILDMMVDGTERHFLSTIYQGIIKLVFNPKTKSIISIQGKDGEKVNLHHQVTTGVWFEKWLLNLETQMMVTMKKMIIFAY